MKKILKFKIVVAIFAVSTLFACIQDAIDYLPVQTGLEQSTMQSFSKYRTYAEALAIAQDAVGMLGENCATRSGKSRSVNTSDVQYIVSSFSTRSAGVPDTLMYIFNYEDNAGFAVVSANRATEGLIAVTEQGNYSVGKETENGGFGLYMTMAEAYVGSRAQPASVGPVEFTQYKIVEHRDTISYGPYLQVRWGQDWPYNISCPTMSGTPTKAGCVAVALAQIMTYYKHPDSFTVTHTPMLYEQTLYWDYILEHRYTETGNTSNCDQCTTTGGHYLIASLIRQLGEYLQMVYGVKVSGCDSEFAKGALQTFGYTSGNYQRYSSNLVNSSIFNGKLVYMRGGISGDDGHAWVVDGYRKITITVQEYIKPNSSQVWIEQSCTVTSDTYNHINWGWDGDSNGYFLSNVFNTAAPSQLDPNMSIVESRYNFTIDLKIIPNISKN